jgi:SAM-dependent methyltransferase
MGLEDTPHDEVELARLFGLVHRGSHGDLDYYLRETAGARHVLELGCGTGRILGPVARAGTPITGIERSAAMIAAGRGTWLDGLPAHARILLGDMRSFSLRDRFDRVVIPYNSLFALETDGDINRTLSGAFDHLEEGGKLIFDCYVLEEGAAMGTASAFRKVESVLDGGRRIEVFEQEGPELPGRRFEMRYRYRVHTSGQPVHEILDSVRHHFVPPDLLLSFVRDAGFLVESTAGDFDGRAFDPKEASIIVIVAVKPAGRAGTATLGSSGTV